MIDYIKYFKDKLDNLYSRANNSDMKLLVSEMKSIREEILKTKISDLGDLAIRGLFNETLENLIGDNHLGFSEIEYFEYAPPIA